MPVHRLSDTEYTELLQLILREAKGDHVADLLAPYSASHAHWIREWSMLLGYVEISGFMFDPHSPTGFALPAPRLSESGHAKLEELQRTSAMAPLSQRSGNHLMWFPAGSQ